MWRYWNILSCRFATSKTIFSLFLQTNHGSSCCNPNIWGCYAGIKNWFEFRNPYKAGHRGKHLYSLCSYREFLLRQGDCYKYEASLENLMSSRLAWKRSCFRRKQVTRIACVIFVWVWCVHACVWAQILLYHDACVVVRGQPQVLLHPPPYLRQMSSLTPSTPGCWTVSFWGLCCLYRLPPCRSTGYRCFPLCPALYEFWKFKSFFIPAWQGPSPWSSLPGPRLYSVTSVGSTLISLQLPSWPFFPPTLCFPSSCIASVS